MTDNHTQGRNWQIVPAHAAHTGYIARHMRGIDRREVWAFHRHTPQEALDYSLAASQRGKGIAWTCLVDDRPAFMFGVAPDPFENMLDVGRAWLLATNDIYRIAKSFVQHSKFYVDEMQRRFDFLSNYVHCKNVVSQRWLKWCGFEIDAVPSMVDGEDFYYFCRVSPTADEQCTRWLEEFEEGVRADV